MKGSEAKAIRGQMDETDFALLIGVSPVTVWRWERRGDPPSGAAVTLLELIRDHRREALKLLWKRLRPKMNKKARKADKR